MSIENDTIWKDYGNQPLSFGKVLGYNYNKDPYFEGCIYKIALKNGKLEQPLTKTHSFTTSEKIIKIPILGQGEIKAINFNIV